MSGADERSSVSRRPGASGRPPEEVSPVRIGPDRDASRLEVVWQDGHVSQYPPRWLRLNCRCAGCRDEMTGRPLLDPARVPEAVHPLRIEYVGSYALRFEWSDGHDTGIYPFTLLRGLCPCEECAGAAEPAG